MEDYRINQSAYSGPLDLLLYLIKKSEVDIYDISVSDILDQYVAYIEVLKALDIDEVGDFMVMASRLMEIKSWELLPRHEEEEGIEDEDLSDPREELVKELLEYKKFRDRSMILELLGTEQSRRFERKPLPEEGETPIEDEGEILEDVSLWDLVTAFSRISKEVLANLPIRLVTHTTPVSAYIDRIVELMGDKKEKSLKFASLFTRASDRIEMVGFFLGVLELIRQRRIRIRPGEDSGDFLLEERDPNETPPPELEVVGPEPQPIPKPFPKEAFASAAQPDDEEAALEDDEPGQPQGETSMLKGLGLDILEKLKSDTAKLMEFEKALDGVSTLEDGEDASEEDTGEDEDV